MVFEPEAFVYHRHPSRLKDYLKSKFYRGYWRVRLYRKHPKKMIKDSYTPQSLKFQILSIIFILLFGVFSLFDLFWVLPLSVAIGSFIFFSIPFFVLFREKRYPKSIFIPPILFLRALSYLLGILYGVANGVLKNETSI